MNIEKIIYEIQMRKDDDKGWYWTLGSRFNGIPMAQSTKYYVNKFSCAKTAKKLNEDLDMSILVER